MVLAMARDVSDRCKPPSVMIALVASLHDLAAISKAADCHRILAKMREDGQPTSQHVKPMV